jgi:hypothetical protein
MLYNGDTKGLKTTYSPYDAFGIEALKRGFKQYPTPLKEDAKRDFDMEAKRFILPGESVLPYTY